MRIPTRRCGCENWTVYRTLLMVFNKTCPRQLLSVGAASRSPAAGMDFCRGLHGPDRDPLPRPSISDWNRPLDRRNCVTSPPHATSDERDLFWACWRRCGNFGVMALLLGETPDAPDHATIATSPGLVHLYRKVSPAC